MIDRLLRAALHQRFLSIVIGLALVGLGLWAFTQLSIEAYPDISDTPGRGDQSVPGPRCRGDRTAGVGAESNAR